MRTSTKVAATSVLLFTAAILASATALPCAARVLSRSAAETGLSPDLVNRPVCGIAELSDDYCRHWPGARSHPFDE